VLPPIEVLVYDGEKLWLSGPQGGLVVQPNGTVVQTSVPACGPNAMLFDGRSVWFGSGSSLLSVDAITYYAITYMSMFSMGLLGTITGLAFDGTHVWFASEFGATGQLISLRASDGQLGVPYSLNFVPIGVVFDGSHLWVADGTNYKVVKYARSGAEIGRYPAGSFPERMVFDGGHLWVTGQSGTTVSKLRASDGTSLGTFTTDPAPSAMVFDGVNLWVTSNQSRSLTRL
jgi:hypothetical protein